MLYIVEIPIGTEPKSLLEQMNQMRTWLDHMQYQPVGFRRIEGKAVCRVDFVDEAQARNFASAFAGQMMAL